MAFQYDIPFQVDLSDRVALVTGGNGGIGGMFCRALAACGATVIVLGRNLERCQKVADEINAGGGKADAISGDVTDEAAMLRVKDEIAKKYGGLNILINAAGGAVKSAMVPQDQMADPGEKTFFEVGADDIQKEFDLNMRGTWLPSKIMTPLMIGQQGACVHSRLFRREGRRLQLYPVAGDVSGAFGRARERDCAGLLHDRAEPRAPVQPGRHADPALRAYRERHADAPLRRVERAYRRDAVPRR